MRQRDRQPPVALRASLRGGAYSANELHFNNGQPRRLRLCQVRVLGEERDFVAVGYRHVAFTSFALKAMDGHEPGPLFGYWVAAVFTFKDEVDAP